MSIDLNDAEPQRGALIESSFAKIVGVLRPGGINGSALADRGLLKASKSGNDVMMLDWEFTIAEGRNARRKFWQTMVVSGGEVDDKGQSKGWNITKSQLRAMIDSSLGLNPKDESDVARQRRVIQSLYQLSGISFIAKIGIKRDKDGKYSDQNILSHVVTPDEKEWQLVMNGQDVPVSGAATTGQAPVWSGAPSAASTPQPQPQWGTTPQPAAAAAWPQQPAQASAMPPVAAAATGPAWLNN